MGFHSYHHPEPLLLENGKSLNGLTIAYHTYGKPNADQSNVVWVCHALTANSDVFDWWKGLFGEADLFNPEEHFIICANILGSAYGSTHPLSIDPATGGAYYLDFPELSVRDLVSAHQVLAQHLGIHHIEVLIGGSLGGQQALEWAIIQPRLIQKLILIATNAAHSPWGIAFNESQRLAILADPTFERFSPVGGKQGLKAARSIALLSYRNYQAYNQTQAESDPDKIGDYRAASYQNYQGDKLVNRFDAYSYFYLTKVLDSHNVARHRGSKTAALAQIKAETLVIGISSDILFPVAEQRELAELIPEAKYLELDSDYGHDGFLIETDLIGKHIQIFLEETSKVVNHG